MVEVIFNFWFNSMYAVTSIQFLFESAYGADLIFFFQIWDNLQDGLYIR